tara:strand:+ start:476 stop:1333 length:858 start_codon:yes stop_codon:yes gene_type:complete
MSMGYFSDEFCDDLTRYMKKNPQGAAYFKRLRKRLQSHAINFKLPNHGFILPSDEECVLVSTDILKPPFPVTVIEYTSIGGDLKPDQFYSSKRLVMAVEEGDSVVLFPAYYVDDSAEWFPPFVYWRFYYGKQLSLSRAHPREIPDEILSVGEGWDGAIMNDTSLDYYASMAIENVSQELSVYMDFCKALAEYDTEFIDHRPDAETARKRRIRGKKPLYTYKVITITGKRRVSEVSKGGTHASPVAHLRRGHWRTYKSGRKSWVRAAMINGTDGIVVKDYKMESRA